MRPFAMEIYDRHLRGDTVEAIAAEMRIPRDRVEQRLRAAEAWIERRPSA